MNIHDYQFLLSERTSLNRMLAQTPESAVLDRMSLNDRLQTIESELKEYDGYSPYSVSASLTFRGKPVVGSRGIYADFGSKAVNAFSKAVSLVGASSRGPLAPKGRVSHSEDYRLIITGTAVGSYGFKIEAASHSPTSLGEVTPVEAAITRVKAILEASVGTDEELANVIAEVDNRALRGVHDFLKAVADNKAICSLAFKGDVFRFHDVDQVRHSQNRLNQIREEYVTLTGIFIGFFPHGRRAQFAIRDVGSDFWGGESGRVITAKVQPTVTHSLNINRILNQQVTIDARTRRVGSGQPSYVIVGLHA